MREYSPVMVRLRSHGEAQRQYRLCFHLVFVLAQEECIIAVIPGGGTQQGDLSIVQNMQQGRECGVASQEG